MPRPRRLRRIWFCGNFFDFVPRNLTCFDEVMLSVDEFEAIRLVDFEDMGQEKAAKKMKVSQPTLSRILRSARKKISDAIINGKGIKIQGGVYKMVGSRRIGRGFGRGRRGGPLAAGPGGYCVCPVCGYGEPHQAGIPCNQKKCPKCGTLMVRR